jgi:hypothetical protein
MNNTFESIVSLWEIPPVASRKAPTCLTCTICELTLFPSNSASDRIKDCPSGQQRVDSHGRRKQAILSLYLNKKENTLLNVRTQDMQTKCKFEIKVMEKKLELNIK